MATTGVLWEHAWNLIEAIEHRPGDTEIIHECSHCGDRVYGADAKMPRFGCPYGPSRRRDEVPSK